MDDEELRGYFLHLKNNKRLARATTTIALCAIKFFVETTLKRDWTAMNIPRPRAEHKLPVVLSRDEVWRILDAVRELRHRACLTLIYTCGLRLGEGCRLEVGDIQRARGLIHIRAAKGNKDRYVPIPAETLEILTECWKSHRNPRWLFPRVGRGGVHGAGADQPVPISTVQQAFRKAMLSTGQRKDVHVHTLRHSYATHLLEDGCNLRQIQVWREPQPGFLVPVRVLSALFRARFRDALRQRLPEVFAAIPAQTWRRDWVVHSKSVGNGRNALRYLARYIYRVAIADSAIDAHDGETVAFRYRESDTKKVRRPVLPAPEFIRRFLQHVLPSGFVKVRHYGLHHPTRKSVLLLVRAMLYLRRGVPMPRAMEPEEPLPPPLCPRCATPMERRERTWRPIRAAVGSLIACARGPPVAS